MKLDRIYGLILRNLYAFKRSGDRLTDAFYWPAVDIVLWGLTSKFFIGNSPDGANLVTVVLSGMILWIVLWKSQYEVSINLLDELWNKNLVNIFGSPVKFSEWITSTLILGLIKVMMSLSFAIFLAYTLYAVRIFDYGFMLLPYMVLLIISGWVFGFFVTGLILRFGSKIQTTSWSLIWIFAPFCGIYYPTSVLPEWARVVSKIFPMSYTFEGMREVIKIGYLDPQKIVTSLLLNLIYLVFAIWFLRSGFAKAMEKGLIKVN